MLEIKAKGENGPVTTMGPLHARKVIKTLPAVDVPEILESPVEETYWGDPEIQRHLKGVYMAKVENTAAYRRLAWDSWGNRCQVVAGKLAVDVDEFSKYLWSFVKKAPDLNSNGWDYRQDLASYLVWRVLHNAKGVRGDFQLVKLAIASGFRDWYRAYGRDVTRNKVLQSVTLDREKWDTDIAPGLMGADLVQWEWDTDHRLDVVATFKALPERVRTILERKLSDNPLLASERKHLTRWLNNSKRVASNGEILKARLMGKPGAWALEFGVARKN